MTLNLITHSTGTNGFFVPDKKVIMHWKSVLLRTFLLI